MKVSVVPFAVQPRKPWWHLAVSRKGPRKWTLEVGNRALVVDLSPTKAKTGGPVARHHDTF